jgi:hypothetical protein
LAKQHAEESRSGRESDAHIDAMTARLAGDETYPIPDEEPGTREIDHAMSAIVAATNAIDGVYGSVKPLINPPRSNAKRHRQILETLKLGFSVGRHAKQWLDDLDWLYDIRDSIVHHSEDDRPLVVARVTQQSVIIGGPETFRLSADSAERAAAIAQTILRTCIEHPKAATKKWAVERREMVGLEAQAIEGADTVAVNDTRTRLA